MNFKFKTKNIFFCILGSFFALLILLFKNCAPVGLDVMEGIESNKNGEEPNHILFSSSNVGSGAATSVTISPGAKLVGKNSLPSNDAPNAPDSVEIGDVKLTQEGTGLLKLVRKSTNKTLWARSKTLNDGATWWQAEFTTDGELKVSSHFTNSNRGVWWAGLKKLGGAAKIVFQDTEPFLKALNGSGQGIWGACDESNGAKGYNQTTDQCEILPPQGPVTSITITESDKLISKPQLGYPNSIETQNLKLIMQDDGWLAIYDKSKSNSPPLWAVGDTIDEDNQRSCHGNCKATFHVGFGIVVRYEPSATYSRLLWSTDQTKGDMVIFQETEPYLKLMTEDGKVTWGACGKNKIFNEATESCVALQSNPQCGRANRNTFDIKPTTDLCDNFAGAVTVTGDGPWAWTCGDRRCGAFKKLSPVSGGVSLTQGQVEDRIKYLYMLTLNRLPDSGGLDYYVKAVLNKELTLQDAAGGMIASQEFNQLNFGNQSLSGNIEDFKNFTNSVFRTVMRRELTIWELGSYIGKFFNRSKWDLIKEIIKDNEFKIKNPNLLVPELCSS